MASVMTAPFTGGFDHDRRRSISPFREVPMMFDHHRSALKMVKRRQSSGLRWKQLHNDSGATHSYSHDEVTAFAAHVNRVLGGDAELRSRLPLPEDDPEAVFEAISDGVVLTKLVRLAAPQAVIASRKLNLGLPLSIYQKTENCNLVIDACRLAGCNIVNVGSEDIIDGRPHIVLSLLWQSIRIHLLGQVTLANCPDLLHLYVAPAGCSGADASAGDAAAAAAAGEAAFLALPPEEILLRWVNHHLEWAGHPRRVSNFGRDLADGVCLCALVGELLAGTAADTTGKAARALASAAQEDDCGGASPASLRRAGLALAAAASDLKVEPFIRPEHVVAANKRLNLAFVAQLFNARPRVHPLRKLRPAAKTVQRWFRSRRRARRRSAAATTLQNAWCRRGMRRSSAAAVVQLAWRKKQQRRKTAARRTAAATSIALCYVRYTARRREAAAASIQRPWRRNRARAAARAAAAAAAALRVAAARQGAAARVQRRWRAHRVVRQNNAASAIQRFYGAAQSRAAAKQAAAGRVQRSWRRHQARRVAKAAVVMQVFWKQAKARASKKEAGAGTIQRHWRLFRVRRAAKAANAATAIQRCCRAARKRAAAKQVAAGQLQRSWRGRRSRTIAAKARARRERIERLKAPLRAAAAASRLTSEWALQAWLAAEARAVALAAALPDGRKQAWQLEIEEAVAVATDSVAPLAMEVAVVAILFLWLLADSMSVLAATGFA